MILGLLFKKVTDSNKLFIVFSYTENLDNEKLLFSRISIRHYIGGTFLLPQLLRLLTSKMTTMPDSSKMKRDAFCNTVATPVTVLA